MAETKGHLPCKNLYLLQVQKEKRSLIRLVLSNEQVVTRDDHGNGKGRGAYVCPDKTCIEGLLDAGRLNRAFKMKGRFSFHPALSPVQGFILDG